MLATSKYQLSTAQLIHQAALGVFRDGSAQHVQLLRSLHACIYQQLAFRNIFSASCLTSAKSLELPKRLQQLKFLVILNLFQTSSCIHSWGSKVTHFAPKRPKVLLPHPAAQTAPPPPRCGRATPRSTGRKLPWWSPWRRCLANNRQFSTAVFANW